MQMTKRSKGASHRVGVKEKERQRDIGRESEREGLRDIERVRARLYARERTSEKEAIDRSSCCGRELDCVSSSREGAEAQQGARRS